jgi:hypothetical protein
MDTTQKQVVGITPQQSHQELITGVSQNLNSAGFQDANISPNTVDKPILEVVPNLGEHVQDGLEIVEGVTSEVPRAVFGGSVIKVAKRNPLSLLKEKLFKRAGQSGEVREK